jgi:hypothetical protein
VFSCIGIGSLLPPFLADRIADFLKFEVCWGADYGTKIQATVNFAPSPWSVMGYIRWMKNVLPNFVLPGYVPSEKGNNCVMCEENLPVVGLMICYEMSIAKITRGADDLWLPNPKTASLTKVVVEAGMVFCVGFSVQLGANKPDIALHATAGPFLRLKFGSATLLEGFMRIWGVMTFKECEFLDESPYVKPKELAIDVFWEVGLSATTPSGNQQNFVNMRGEIYSNGDFRAEDVIELPWEHFNNYDQAVTDAVAAQVLPTPAPAPPQDIGGGKTVSCITCGLVDHIGGGVADIGKQMAFIR